MLGRFRGKGELDHVYCVQASDEIAALLDFLRAQNVHVACELGTYKGGTLFMLTRVLPDDATIISVDVAQREVHKTFARKNQKLVVIENDLRRQETVEAVRAACGGRALDFLFIDADHSAAGVRSDFSMYAPLVRDGGWVGFHDIIPNRREADWGVPALWAELKQEYQTTEFVDDYSRAQGEGLGIGVLRWTGK